MPPRKRRRSLWSALSETSAVPYSPCHTRMTIGNDGILHLTLEDATQINAPKPVRTLFASEDITDFHDDQNAPVAKVSHPVKKKRSTLPKNADDDFVVQSFGSFPETPPVENRKLVASAEPIEESPSHLHDVQKNKNVQRPIKQRPIIPPDKSTPTIVRTLLPAMEQEVVDPDQLNLKKEQISPNSGMSVPCAAPTLQTPNAQRNAANTSISPNSSSHYTPLMITTSAIRRAQTGLGLTPDTPGHSGVIAISREYEEELRAIQSSTRKMSFSTDDLSSAPSSSRKETPLKSPAAVNDADKEKQLVSSEKRVSPKEMHFLNNGTNSTPGITKRRLSAMSAVTPIPLNFESPVENRKSISVCESAEKPPHVSKIANNVPLFTNGKGVPLPTAKRVQMASPITPAASKRGIEAYELGNSSKSGADSAFKVNNPAPFLFTNGKGVPLKPSPVSRVAERILDSAEQTDKIGPKPPAGPSLFMTGSGKKVSIPTPKTNTGTSAKPLDIAALFSTGSGKPVPLLDEKKTPTRHSRPPVSPHVPLFSRGAEQNLLTVGKGKAVQGVEDRTPRQRTRKGAQNSSHGLSRMLKTTPFKRPRQLSKPHFSPGEPRGATKQATETVPKFDVPRLLRNGLFECANRSHTHRFKCTAPPSNLQPAPDFVLSVGSFQRCLDYSFNDTNLGPMGCHSPEVLKYFSDHDLQSFDVYKCVEWIKKLFPDVAARPATCVGSIAWTKLAYALAVWKLGRLDLKYNRHNRTTGCRYLCVANVVREFLRRISYEWTQNRQPHLLRIMRRDSAAASHTVLLIGDLEDNQTKGLLVTVTDGWYVARAAVDKIVERRFRRGKIRIGDSVHLSGAGLDSAAEGLPFFCGDGDETSTSMLKISANNVRKRVAVSFERLGMQRHPLVMKSLNCMVEDGGQCPTVKAVILRSYPIFYVETILDEGDGTTKFIFRREDAEFEARAAFEEQTRQKFAAAVDTKREGDQHSPVDLPEVVARDVRSGKEILICGTDDDPTDSRVRKVIRVYSPSEDIENYLRQEGEVLFLSQLWPKKHAWSCKPQGIAPATKSDSEEGLRVLQRFPRRGSSLQDLRSNHLKPGDEFDGAFCVLHVAEKQDGPRFVYFTDAPDINDIQILALEMSGYDAQYLPRALRFNAGRGRSTMFPIVALRDVEFTAFNKQHSLIHARATLRSSFVSVKAKASRSSRNNSVPSSISRLEQTVRKKQDELVKLREATVAFSSGEHVTIGAYFTGTRDMEQGVR